MELSDGAFTTVGCDRGRPLLWRRHRGRLAATLGRLHPGAPVRLPGLAELTADLAAAGLGGPARLRVAARWRRDGWVVGVGVAALSAAGPELPPLDLGVVELPQQPPGLGLKVLARRAWDDARAAARARGAGDALLAAAGVLLETAVANVWLRHGDELATPPAPAQCLPGVLRGWLLAALPGCGLRVAERQITVAELAVADEVWVSNALVGVRRVGRVAGRCFAAWPAFEKVAALGVPAPGWPRRPTSR